MSGAGAGRPRPGLRGRFSPGDIALGVTVPICCLTSLVGAVVTMVVLSTAGIPGYGGFNPVLALSLGGYAAGFTLLMALCACVVAVPLAILIEIALGPEPHPAVHAAILGAFGFVIGATTAAVLGQFSVFLVFVYLVLGLATGALTAAGWLVAWWSASVRRTSTL